MLSMPPYLAKHIKRAELYVLVPVFRPELLVQYSSTMNTAEYLRVVLVLACEIDARTVLIYVERASLVYQLGCYYNKPLLTYTW